MAIKIPPGEMLEMYAAGWFPMACEGGEIRLFSPNPRGVLPLEEFHIPHGARRTLSDPAWQVRLDTAFADVIAGCAARRETWISQVIFESYVELHRCGHAHSVEVWRDGCLAGGLYGVHLGGAFFGESMFHRVSGASKVALVVLVDILRRQGFSLLDIQWITPHLSLFGAREIPRHHYLAHLRRALAIPAEWPSAQIHQAPSV